MIADLKPYPVMKDSAVPWLVEVLERLGRIIERGQRVAKETTH